MKRLSLLAAGLTLAVGTAAAQTPAGSLYALASFSSYQGIVFFDNNGQTGTLNLTTASSDSIEMSRDNRSYVVTDTNQCVEVDVATGTATNFAWSNTTSTANWGCLGENDDYWSFRSGAVLRHDNTYANESTFATVPTGLQNAGCWDGTTGGVVAVAFSGTPHVQFIDPNGNITMTVAVPGSLCSGADWNPFDGSIMVSRFSSASTSGLYKIDRSGLATSITAAGLPELLTANSVECREGASEEYLVTDFGGAPRHISTVDAAGNVTSVANTSTTWGPSDACYINSRQLWTAGTWTSPGTGNFYFNAPQNANENYFLAASFSHAPGIPVGANTVHLAADPLLFLSISAPSIFQNFAGSLDATGSPTLPPSVNIPAGLSGLGIRVFFSGITISGGVVTSALNVCGTIVN